MLSADAPGNTTLERMTQWMRGSRCALIRDHFGRGWTWISVGTPVLACVGALYGELYCSYVF